MSLQTRIMYGEKNEIDEKIIKVRSNSFKRKEGSLRVSHTPTDPHLTSVRE